MNKKGNIIWGIILVVIGVILGLNALEITNIDIFFKGWWTLFLILPSISGLVKKQNILSNTIFLVLGILLLLTAHDLFDFAIVWKLFFPVVIILIGLKFILEPKLNKDFDNKILEVNSENKKVQEVYTTFGEEKLQYNDLETPNLILDATFGSITMDFTTMEELKEDIYVKTSAIFGGVNLRMPNNVNIGVKSNCMFGGVENKKYLNKKDGKYKTIYIDAFCLFGGVEII